MNVAKLPLSPFEAFVLSQLDVAADAEELAAVTNSDERAIEKALEHLAELGAIERPRANHVAYDPRSDPRGDEGPDSGAEGPRGSPRTRKTVTNLTAAKGRTIAPKKALTGKMAAVDPSKTEGARSGPVKTPSRSMERSVATSTRAISREDPEESASSSRAGPTSRRSVGPKRSVTPLAVPRAKTMAPPKQPSIPPKHVSLPPKKASIPPESGGPRSRRMQTARQTPTTKTTPPRGPSIAPKKASLPPRKPSTHVMRAAKIASIAPAAEDAIDISPERRLQIDDMLGRLETQTHYQLLGVERTATSKEIKSAYFASVMVFHPDKYFGKRLGAYKSRLEKIFARLTNVSDVLSNSARRQSYDVTLPALPPAQATESPRVETATPTPTPLAATPAPTTIVESPQIDVRSAGEAPQSASRLPLSSRRQFLAAKLGRPGGDKSSEATDPLPSQSAQVAADPAQSMAELRRFLQSGRMAKQANEPDPYRATAERAFADGDWVSAVNAARIALTLTPDDAALKALLESATTQAAGLLTTSYKTRAAYEEGKENWEAAARAYERVAEGSPTDPKPLIQASECLLRAGTDVRGAVRLARSAVALDPKKASHRLTLAKANEAAGLVESALGELERALKLAPEDVTIAPWIARLRALRH